MAGIAWAAASAAGAQQPKDDAVPAAPVPIQILSGKRVFVANGGTENFASAFGALFSGGPDRAYNQFYAGLKQWGRYQLVSSPSQADMVFEIGFTLGGSAPPELGHLRVSIRDPRNNVLLWAFSEYVQSAVLKGNRDKNFDQSMAALLEDMRNLVAQPGAGAKP